MPRRLRRKARNIPDMLSRALAVRLSFAEIANRYHSSSVFIHYVFRGRRPCPPRLAALIERMVGERCREVEEACTR